MGRNHLEAPLRIQVIREALRLAQYNTTFIKANSATQEDILQVHDRPLYELLKESSNSEEFAFTADTIANSYTYDACLTAAGGSIQVAEDIGTELSFGMLRPPGHHATFDTAMGFCFFNNIAIAAKRLLINRIGRIAIIDIDNHHGNGTQDIFYANPKVLYTSIHADPRYSFPGTGRIDEVGVFAGEGKTVNIPLPINTHDSPYLYAFDSIIDPIVRQFEPAAILVSLGLDALEGDPYGSLGLSINGYYELGRRIHRIADSNHKKIGVILEGGYLYKEIGKAVNLFFLGLQGMGFEGLVEPKPTQEVQELVYAIKSLQRNYWYDV